MGLYIAVEGCNLHFFLLFFALLSFSFICVLAFAKNFLCFIFSCLPFIVIFFSSFLFVMANFEKVKDVHGWLANHEVFETMATKLKVDPSRRLFGLEYEVYEEGFLVSEVRSWVVWRRGIFISSPELEVSLLELHDGSLEGI